MKRTCLALAGLLTLAGAALAQPKQAVVVREIDGSPAGKPTIIEVSNGTLVDLGGGIFQVTTGGGGGGATNAVGVVSTNGTTAVAGALQLDFTNSTTTVIATVISNANGVAWVRTEIRGDLTNWAKFQTNILDQFINENGGAGTNVTMHGIWAMTNGTPQTWKTIRTDAAGNMRWGHPFESGFPTNSFNTVTNGDGTVSIYARASGAAGDVQIASSSNTLTHAAAVADSLNWNDGDGYLRVRGRVELVTGGGSIPRLEVQGGAGTTQINSTNSSFAGAFSALFNGAIEVTGEQTNRAGITIQPAAASTNASQVNLFETNGANYFRWQGADASSTDVIAVVPNTLPTAGQVFTATAVSGSTATMGWTTPGGGGGSGVPQIVTNSYVSGGTNFSIDATTLTNDAIVRITLTQDSGLLFTNAYDGKRFRLEIAEDSTGTWRLALNTNILNNWRLSQEITGANVYTNANHISTLGLIVRGTNCWPVANLTGFAP